MQTFEEECAEGYRDALRRLAGCAAGYAHPDGPVESLGERHAQVQVRLHDDLDPAGSAALRHVSLEWKVGERLDEAEALAWPSWPSEEPLAVLNLGGLAHQSAHVALLLVCAVAGLDPDDYPQYGYRAVEAAIEDAQERGQNEEADDD